MPEQVMPRSDFLYSKWVDKTIRQLVEEELLWERLLTKQPVNGLSVLYYKEQYLDIETPNDSAMSRPIDEFLRSPGYRAPGSTFPHTTYAEPKEYNLGLYQLALEIDIPDEAQKYVEMENTILKAQRKLGNSFASRVNALLGEKLTDSWSTASTVVNNITVSSGAEWSGGPTTSAVRPLKNILDAMEKVEDVPGYNYKADGLLVSKQSFFDLMEYVSEKGIDYKESVKLEAGRPTVGSILGLSVFATNQVKRDFAVVGDFKAAGVLFEAEAVTTRQYYTDVNRATHVQISRTFNYALTDPKAICVIVNVA